MGAHESARGAPLPQGRACSGSSGQHGCHTGRPPLNALALILHISHAEARTQSHFLVAGDVCRSRALAPVWAQSVLEELSMYSRG